MIASRVANMHRTDTLKQGSRSAEMRNGISQPEAAYSVCILYGRAQTIRLLMPDRLETGLEIVSEGKEKGLDFTSNPLTLFGRRSGT